VITDLVKGHIRSYRQLPFILYQIQTKFRDEPRPRFGVIRSCEFIMKDAYSFDADETGLQKNYAKMRAAYIRIFNRCGLEYIISKADPGVMGGDVSEEFMAPAESGEDVVTACSACAYAVSGRVKHKTCPNCTAKLAEKTALELGHIFQLKTKYTKSLKVNFLATDGKQKPVVMGCYGIGINRIMAAVIEQNYDKHGIIWPKTLAPYAVEVLPLNIEDSKSYQVAVKIYRELKNKETEVLLDDRPERAGVKFKDADLIGIPLQIIIGKSFIESGLVEIKKRAGQKIFKRRPSFLSADLKELL
jgi:prolyl-tRNA synthetase